MTNKVLKKTLLKNRKKSRNKETPNLEQKEQKRITDTITDPAQINTRY